jgi:two-component system response regulator VanR
MISTDCGTVLVVDDDDDFRALVGALLRGVGFAVREADCADEAIVAAREARPDLVLTDVNMPAGSGYELCRRLRDEFGEELPIVFLTGERIESIDRVAGLLLGADDYLVKPFDPGELVARARRLAWVQLAPRNTSSSCSCELTLSLR